MPIDNRVFPLISSDEQPSATPDEQTAAYHSLMQDECGCDSCTTDGAAAGPTPGFYDELEPASVIVQPERLDFMPESSLSSILERAFADQQSKPSSIDLARGLTDEQRADWERRCDEYESSRERREITDEVIAEISLFKLICKRWGVIALLRWTAGHLDALATKIWYLSRRLEP